MLTLAEARSVAERHVERFRQEGSDVVLNGEFVVERPTCFAFVYNSRAYLEGRDEMAMLIGPGPLIVDRRTGEVHERNSAYSAEQHAREYEKSNSPLHMLAAEPAAAGRRWARAFLRWFGLGVYVALLTVLPSALRG